MLTPVSVLKNYVACIAFNGFVDSCLPWFCKVTGAIRCCSGWHSFKWQVM